MRDGANVHDSRCITRGDQFWCCGIRYCICEAYVTSDTSPICENCLRHCQFDLRDRSISKILAKLCDILLEDPYDHHWLMDFAESSSAYDIPTIPLKRRNYCIVLGQCRMKPYLLMYLLANHDIREHKNILYIPSDSIKTKFVFIGFRNTSLSRTFTRKKYIAKTLYEVTPELADRLNKIKNRPLERD